MRLQILLACAVLFPALPASGQDQTLLFPDDGPWRKGIAVKGGYVSSLGGGFYEQRVEDGWQIDLTFRAPIARYHQPGAQPISFFVEYGVSHHTLNGDNQPVTTSGSFTVTGLNGAGVSVGTESGNLDSFFDTRLERLSYTNAQLGIGAFVFPNAGHRNIYFTGLVGVRWGVVSARFNNTATPSLQAALANAVAMLPPATASTTTALQSDVKKDDAYFSLYGDIGAEWSITDCLHLGAHVEFDQLWINLGDFGRSDGNLGTVSVLSTVTIWR